MRQSPVRETALAPHMVNLLEIRLLGPLEVQLGGRPVGVSGSKRHGLLAVLALRHGRVVAVDELIDALWGEELPAAPRNALQHHVARLRAALGQESIVSSSDGYALGDVTVDVVRFEELLAEARAASREGDARAGADSIELALALWRGPALQGLAETEWLGAEARRLEALRVDALEERFETALALGEHREIVSALRATLDENPFRERVWGQLMLALYRGGRQADALETFQEARRVLAEQLGLEPGPELRRLQEAILAHDPAIAPVPVVAPRRGNLPSPTTSFVDRERELAALVALLREHRLVTLTGPPGVGKSRLALEVGRSLESDLRDGGWLVELARAGGAADVERVVADAVDARGPDPLARVIARLRDAEAILLLDACEHALAEAARVASAVLSECPGVRMLATSREVLHRAGEVPVTLKPLRAPEAAATDGAESPAVQLFAARARAARPGFELTADAVPLAAKIARRVDGLPLAIELVAARINVLGLAQLSSLVERRLALLRNRPPSDPIRTALQGLVEWSYELLNSDEKTLLHQLAVHRGGASLSSLVAVAANDGLDEGTVTHLLAALVDKSIISVSFPDEDARYDLLDTVRDYALERQAESGGLDAARKAHGEYFATLADAARPGLRGSEWLNWVRRLELENDNLWAALSYARDPPDPGVAIRLGGSLGLYFSFAERVSEGRQFLELALATPSHDASVGLRIELLGWLCFLAMEELDLDAAIEAGERALALSATAPAPAESALARALLALPLTHSGDHQRAAKLAEEAREASETAGDQGVGAVVRIAGATRAVGAGDVPTAAALIADTIRHAEAIDYLPSLLPATLLEAWVAERQEDEKAAIDAYSRALELANRPHFADHAAFALARLGSHALARGNLLEAEELFRRALAAAYAARTPWVTAYARVELGRTRAAAGDANTAETLYRNALEWSVRPRPHRARESLFVTIAGSPATGALLGLADLAAARGDAEAADEMRARAELAVA
jgi:predicted ATPase/DNA-binding SARP family transcriptional activator